MRFSDCRVGSAVAALALVAVAARAAGQSSWLAPTDGNYDDPSRWSNGVPIWPTAAIFGATSADAPFVVLFSQPTTLGPLLITTQRPIFDLSATQGGLQAGLSVVTLVVAGDPALPPELTLRGGSMQIIDASIGSGIGSAAQPGTLRFEDATSNIFAMNIVHGTLQLAGATSLTSGFGAPIRIGAGPGSDGTLTFEPGMDVLLPPCAIGCAGGSGLLFLSASTLRPATLELGGHTGTNPLDGPGVGTAIIDGGQLLLGSGSSVRIGSVGEGTLVLRGNATVSHVSPTTLDHLVVGANGGDGHLVIDGSATINVPVEQVAGTASLVVTGPDTTATLTKDLQFDASPGPCTVVVDDGATLQMTNYSLAIGYAGNATVSIRNGSTLQSWGVSALQGDLVEVTGPGSRIVGTSPVSVGAAVYSTGTLACTDHARVLMPTLLCKPNSNLVLDADASLPAPIELSTKATLDGTLHVNAQAAQLPIGSTATLLTAPTIVGDFAALALDPIAGYPLLYRREATALTVTATDHVDAFAIDAPSTLEWGYVAHLAASAALDGTTYDVTKSATWTSSDPSVLRVDAPGVVSPLSLGTTVVTVSFGPLSIERSINVTAIPTQSVVLASGSPTLVPNGSSGLTNLTYGTMWMGRAISADGTHVVFMSGATNLFTLSGGAPRQAILAELGPIVGANDLAPIGATAFDQVSVTNDGAPAPGEIYTLALNGDGRYALLTSRSPLTSDPVPSFSYNVYVRDRFAHTTELVSRTLNGSGCQQATGADISSDGRYVFFYSHDADIAPGDTNGTTDAFLHDRSTGTTTRVSLDANGDQLPSPSGAVTMTPDARRVAYYGAPLDGSAPDTWHVIVRDLVSNELFDVNDGLGPSGFYDWLTCGISDDGRFVAFLASVEPIDPTAPPGWKQVVVRDLDTGVLAFASRLPNGTWANGLCDGISISGNGRYVSYFSKATNLSPLATNANKPQIYRYDRVTGALELVSAASDGSIATCERWTSLSADGRSLAFATANDALAPFDLHTGTDVVVRRFGSTVTGDVNADGLTNAFDVAAVIGAWGSSDPSADLDGDGLVGPRDLAIVLGGWTG